MNDISNFFKDIAQAPKVEEVNGVPVLILPPNWTQEDMEHLLDKPKRTSIEEAFRDQAAFVAYVNRFKRDGESWIKLKAGDSGVEAHAHIDYHTPTDPSWCAHKAIYYSKHSDAWKIWAGSSNKMMRQSDFAEFIYDNQADIADLPGAELLEIVQNIKATATSEFREMRDNTGSKELVYRVKVSTTGATSEKHFTLPDRTRIFIPVYEGGKKVLINVDLKMQIPKEDGGALLIGYKLYRTDSVVLDHHNDLATSLYEATGLPIWR